MIKKAIVVVSCVLFSLSGFTQENNSQEIVQSDTIPVETNSTSAEVQPVTSDANQVEQTTSKKEKNPKQNKNKIYYGGYLNLSFGTYTAIGIEPLIGYKVTPKFSVGGKVSYTYVNDKRYAEEYSSSNYGFSLFSRYRFTNRIYGHAEYSLMNYDLYYTSIENNREWVSFLFLGGGFSQPISRNSWITAQVLFDVLQDENSPYTDWKPFFSVGVGVGF